MELEIQHFAHPEHRLILVDLRDTEIQGRIETHKQINREEKAKSESIYGEVIYESSDSEEEVENNDSVCCILCRGKMLESAYSCISCDVHLHMLCAKLPAEMMHPDHIEHPLTLVTVSPVLEWDIHYRNTVRLRGYFECNICHDDKFGYRYSCGSCNFNVDVRCASEAQEIKHEGHEHTLKPFLRTSLFKCGACSTEHSAGVSYKCRTCTFWVHEECSTLPFTIKYNHHVHRLSLFIEIYQGRMKVKRHMMSMICKICDKKIYWKHHWQWSYWCRWCDHQVHVNCLAALLIAERGMKAYEADPEIDVTKVFHVPESFQYGDLIGQMIKHMVTHYCQQEQMVAVVSQVDGPLISHFSHQHPLTPTIWTNAASNNNVVECEEMKNCEIICNACVLPISTPQVYYSCKVSNNYFLHEWCAKLPKVWKRPTYPETTLTLGRDPADDGELDAIPMCESCLHHNDGYIYRSKYDGRDYDFQMDAKCLFLPPAILHKTHQHPLKLVRDCYNEGCVACYRSEESEMAYGCEQCCYYLHFSCALQPITIAHRYDKHHPFILVDAPIKGQKPDDEYVCEFCEEHILPEWWFYHCLPCDVSACVDCISQGKRKTCYINPGVRWYDSRIHHHPLIYVALDYKSSSSFCSLCHHRFGWDHRGHSSVHELALRCEQCDIMFHYKDCIESVFTRSVQREES